MRELVVVLDPRKFVWSASKSACQTLVVAEDLRGHPCSSRCVATIGPGRKPTVDADATCPKSSKPSSGITAMEANAIPDDDGLHHA